jgi:membrane dipeptidase
MNGQSQDHGMANGHQAESPLERAKRLLRTTPLIDGHNDFPFLLRQQLHNQIYDHDLRDNLSCHTSLEKMRRGMMGGQFWSVYVPNPEELRLSPPESDGQENGDASNGHTCGCEHVRSGKLRSLGLNEPNWAVRDTLEQIDITHRLIEAYPSYLKLCTTAAEVRNAFAEGRIASMLGIEGGHSTGNSLGALRLFYNMGVRYMTITHNSDNAFGTSWITVDPAVPGAKDHGLTKFGESCVTEMNRLGMLVDLSHVSAETMRGALKVAKAPVIYSHSSAWTMTRHGRNAPDDVLQTVKTNGGVVMVPAVAPFLREGDYSEANVEDMLDHIVYIANLIGWEHVGLGSDFDGTTLITKGFEVSGNALSNCEEQH